MRVASYILQRFWKKHFLSRMELPQIITKTLREILWFNYMEQMNFLLNSMDVIEGTIDWEALKSGNYVLYALTADDNGNIIDDPNIHVGDTLHFNHVQMNGLSSSIDNNFDCKVMAKVLINENTDTIRSTGFAKFYMPTDVFLPLCEQPHLVSFPFNVVDGMEADMEEFLEQLC